MEYEAIKTPMVSGQFKHARKIIECAFATDSQFAEGRYLNLANWPVLGAHWRLIREFWPGRTNSLLTGSWFRSLVLGCPAPL